MKKIILVFLLGLILLPTFAFADGGMFPPDNNYIYETGQKGAIYYKNKEETLVLSTSYEGDAKDFSWIIPTPTQPDVTKVSKDIFTNLSKLTELEVNKSAPSSLGGAGMLETAVGEVQVLEEKQIGYYDVTVIKSTDENALYDWFKENGYQYPEDGKYILDDYVRLGWIFTAVKITEDAQSNSSIQEKINSGQVAPLKLVFSSDNIVFPLKISGISQYFSEYEDLRNGNDENLSLDTEPISPYYPTGMSIELYVFTDSKQELTGFTTEYADWVNSDQINRLATDEQGNSWVNADQKMYLTKMYRYTELSQMDEDLYPQSAKDNHTVGVLSWWEKIINWAIQYIVVFLIILVLMYFVPIYWQFKSASKACHVISWISQTISFLIIGALPLIYALMISFEIFGYGYVDFSMIMVGIPYIIMPLMMLVLLIAEGVWQKKNIQR